MDLKKSEIISRLNITSEKYQNKVRDSFRLFDYNFELSWTSHFIDRFIQRYPTYDVGNGIIEPMLDLFFENHNNLVFRGVDGFAEYKLVNIRHNNIQKQNVMVVTIEFINNHFDIKFVTIYRKSSDYIKNNPDEYIYLHNKPKFITKGDVAKRISKFSENNNVPEALDIISNLWI